MGHSDSSAHVSGYGGVCCGDERTAEAIAEARRGGLRRRWLQGLKPPLWGGLMSQLKLRPPKKQESDAKCRIVVRGFTCASPAISESDGGSARTVRVAGKWALLFFVRFYQIFLSPFFGGACKFYPSCSRYGYEAIAKHGAWRGSVLAMKRLLRCRPFTKGGFDPVPDVVGEADELEDQGLKPHRTPIVSVAAEAATYKDREWSSAYDGQGKPFADGTQGKQEFAQ